MRETPRPRRRAPNGASCMSRAARRLRGATAPTLRCPPSSAGASKAARRIASPPLAGLGADGGFNGGHLEVGVVFPSAAAAGRGACITRHGLAGPAPLSRYACRRSRGTDEGRPHPPSAARRCPPAVQARPGGLLVPAVTRHSFVRGTGDRHHARPARTPGGTAPWMTRRRRGPTKAQRPTTRWGSPSAARPMSP
jgi:hypothetical protein